MNDIYICGSIYDPTGSFSSYIDLWFNLKYHNIDIDIDLYYRNILYLFTKIIYKN